VAPAAARAPAAWRAHGKRVSRCLHPHHAERVQCASAISCWLWGLYCTVGPLGLHVLGYPCMCNQTLDPQACSCIGFLAVSIHSSEFGKE
jgi:hypothetical protein